MQCKEHKYNYIIGCEDCFNFIKDRNEFLLNALRKQNILFERLDKAMASPERITQDTELVGGFVSGLNLTETDEQIIGRAITRLNKHD